MAEQKQILRISSTDNIRYSVLRLLHECLATAARKGDAQSAIALSKYIFKEFDERDMLLYVETTQYELETIKHVRAPIKKGGDASSFASRRALLLGRCSFWCRFTC